MASRDTPGRTGWRALLDEARRREVHRALAIYGAVLWGAVASAPDLIQYVGAPGWIFPALLVVLALGLPVVAVASWTLDFSVTGEAPLAEQDAHEPVLLTPDDVTRRGAGPTRRVLGWAVPIGLLVAFPFLVRWLLAPAPGGALTVAIDASADVSATLRPPLEWLLGARTEVLPPHGEGTGASLRAARRRGAAYLISSDSLAGGVGTVTATVFDVATGERLDVLSGGGAAESVRHAAGRLSLEIARRLAEREGRPLAVAREVTLETESPMALFNLLEGQRRFGAADFDAAVAAYRRAIEADSSFVPAYYRLAVAQRWLWSYSAGWDALAVVLDGRDVPPRWLRLIRAQQRYLERDAAGAVAGFEQTTLHHPELLEAWLGLGEALFHYGGMLGHDLQEAWGPLERAVATDPSFAPIGHHLVELALWRADPDAARQALAAMPAGHPVRPVMEVALALGYGTSSERAAAWQTAETWDLRLLSLLVAHFGFHPEGRSMADSVAALLTRPERRSDERLRGAQYRLMLADDATWPRALSDWRAARALEPFDTWAVHAHQAGRDVPEAPAMLAWAERQWRSGAVPDFGLSLDHDLRRAFHALIHDAVLRGDSVRTGALLASVERAAPAHPSDPAPTVLSAALRGRLAFLAGDTARAVDELTRAASRSAEPYVAFYPASTMAPERRLLVEWNRALGRQDEADRWLRSFHHSLSFGDLLYQGVIDAGGGSPRSPPPRSPP
ncbi:MAG: hypothetical protein RH859_06010 [Longimicrobiales bacterium]